MSRGIAAHLLLSLLLLSSACLQPQPAALAVAVPAAAAGDDACQQALRHPRVEELADSDAAQLTAVCASQAAADAAAAAASAASAAVATLLAERLSSGGDGRQLESRRVRQAKRDFLTSPLFHYSRVRVEPGDQHRAGQILRANIMRYG
ncbi:hypothetical protein BOX15_Mlig017662g1 [Macrostomum lignano]|uniref:Uncharacterized protein n=1 Tax=Macrostomum lignano TaxID=282301 RepID=A0A267F8X8_9PLAT|nr:hypothetical protein BOX15_Mlig017662g1 [Macrostomum lignano]